MRRKLHWAGLCAAILVGLLGCGRAADPRYLTGEWRLVHVEQDVEGPAGRKTEKVELNENAGILLRFQPATMSAQQTPNVSWALPVGPGETPYRVLESQLEIATGARLGIIEAGTETLELEWLDTQGEAKRTTFYEFKRATPPPGPGQTPPSPQTQPGPMPPPGPTPPTNYPPYGSVPR